MVTYKSYFQTVLFSSKPKLKICRYVNWVKGRLQIRRQSPRQLSMVFDASARATRLCPRAQQLPNLQGQTCHTMCCSRCQNGPAGCSDGTHFVETVRTAQRVSTEIFPCEIRRFRLLSVVYYEHVMSLDISELEFHR